MNSMLNFFSGGLKLPGFLGNMVDWMAKFKRFSQNPVGEIMSMNNVNVPQNFRGGPEDLARYLMNSGQMSKEQFEEFARDANQIQSVLPKF